MNASKNHHLHCLNAMGVTVWVRRTTQPEQLTTATDNPKIHTMRDTPPIATKSIASETDWEILMQTVAQCTACGLHETRIQTVFGVGNRQARCLFVGEAPGANEDAQGEPFVGRAGQLLNNMLHAIQLSREQVFIANVLKCRPPDNRNPNHQEMVRCTPFLRRQIELLQPKLIVALGGTAAQYLLATTTPISQLRGQQFEYADTGITLIPTFHPAYLLRSPQQKKFAWLDLQLIQRLLNEGNQP